MKNNNVALGFTAALLLIGVFIGISCSGGGNPEQVLNDQGYWEISASNITLQWKVVGSDLEVILSAPTTGWVSVGFDPSSRMQGANIILGKFDGGLVVRDDYGTGPTVHAQDSTTQDVTGIDGTEQSGSTTVRFTIPLDSGDSQDKPLTQGQSYKVILAYGASDNFDQQHSARASVTISL
jgi:hypothetical protein